MAAIDANGLPLGWAYSQLEDICDINPSTSSSHVPVDADVTFIPMAAVAELANKIDTSQRRKVVEVKKGYTCFQSGDVLFAKITPCMENGKIAVVPDLPFGIGFGSTEFHILRPKPGIQASYIYQFISQRSFRSNARRAMTGAVGQQRVPKHFVGFSRIPIAPSAEQARIVAKLDELFGEIEAGEQELEHSRAALAIYRRALLKAAVTGELTRDWRQRAHSLPDGKQLLAHILAARRRQWEDAKTKKRQYLDPVSVFPGELPNLPDAWGWASLDELTCGGRASAYGVLQPGPDVAGGVPMVRVGDIRGGRVDLGNLKCISPEIDREFSRTKLQGRELLITLVGAIGRTAIAPGELAGANTARAVGIVPLTDLVNEHWVEIWFRSPAKQIEMVGKAHEVARKTLNLEDVRSAPVAVPPRCEQDEIVRCTSSSLLVADAQELALDAAERDCSALRQAILKSAFRGKLVPQNSSDEPVAILLRRLGTKGAASNAERQREPNVRPPGKTRRLKLGVAT